MIRLLALVCLLVVGCGGLAQNVPFDANVPTGGHVIYRSVGGEHVCVGMSPCPTRIVEIGGLCVTETYREPAWLFESSKPCEVPA